jgi:hypothetical protein
MRLLDTSSITLIEFHNPPKNYAILSHTWEREEVSLQAFGTDGSRSLLGWKKIQKSCELARAEGWEYIWIDTCCIDKTSSAELSEAINSMFNWYKQASVCYVFMADVTCSPIDFKSAEFRGSRWFTRGWTLQELIAPTHLVFLNNEWQELGTRTSLSLQVERATKISYSNLLHFEECSVATRMSWAAHRSTTRIEDQAYCLLGLFGINMPLIYGEGENAFLRLQQEIIRQSDDETIFVWNPPKEGSNSALLAETPLWFQDSAKYRPLTTDPDVQHSDIDFVFTNRGLRTNTRLLKYKGPMKTDGSAFNTGEGTNMSERFGRSYIWLLRCTSADTRLRVGILLLKEPDGRLVRHSYLGLVEYPSLRYPEKHWETLIRSTIYVKSPSPKKSDLATGSAQTFWVAIKAPVAITLGSLDFSVTNRQKSDIYGRLNTPKFDPSATSTQAPSFVPWIKDLRTDMKYEITTDGARSAILAFLRVEFRNRTTRDMTYIPGYLALLICTRNQTPVVGLFRLKFLVRYSAAAAIDRLEDFLVDLAVNQMHSDQLSDTAKLMIPQSCQMLTARCRPDATAASPHSPGVHAIVELSVKDHEIYELEGDYPPATTKNTSKIMTSNLLDRVSTGQSNRPSGNPRRDEPTSWGETKVNLGMLSGFKFTPSKAL